MCSTSLRATCIVYLLLQRYFAEPSYSNQFNNRNPISSVKPAPVQRREERPKLDMTTVGGDVARYKTQMICAEQGLWGIKANLSRTLTF